MPAPLLLALETATAAASVALVRGETLVAERALPAGAAVSAALLPALGALLAGAGVRLSQIDAFAVSIGPGSFTGLRVGLATVKGLAFASERPVAPVSSLEALAAGAPPGPGPVVALLDAQRGEVYGAAFDVGAEGLRLRLEEGLYGLEDLAARLSGSGVFVGEGALLHADALRARLGPGIRIAGEEWRAPRARDVGRIGARILLHGGGIDAARVLPRYLRRAEAEARRTGERTESAGAPGLPDESV